MTAYPLTSITVDTVIGWDAPVGGVIKYKCMSGISRLGRKYCIMLEVQRLYLTSSTSVREAGGD